MMDDTISRREVIDYLNCLLDGRFSKDKEAIIEGIRDNIMMLPNKSVRVHSAQPKTDGDTISRAAALDILYNFAGCIVDTPNGDYHKAYKAYRHRLEILLSAQPERKTGRWIPVDSYTAFGGDEATWLAHGNPVAYHYCSECKNHAYALEDGEDLLSDFCPNCGAKMLKEGEE